jgi:hypothetical protein
MGYLFEKVEFSPQENRNLLSYLLIDFLEIETGIFEI